MKVVHDTNVWIGFLRNPAQKVAFDSRMHRPHWLLSSVVAMELLAGCRTTRREQDLMQLLKPFEKAGRLLTPDHSCFRQAGRVLAHLADDGIGQAHLRQIVNDVLIAVTAVRAGAVVITANASDFARIEKHTPVRWMLPE